MQVNHKPRTDLEGTDGALGNHQHFMDGRRLKSHTSYQLGLELKATSSDSQFKDVREQFSFEDRTTGMGGENRPHSSLPSCQYGISQLLVWLKVRSHKGLKDLAQA